MNDVIVLILTAAFFTVAVAYVGLCDRIIGPDPEPPPDHGGLGDAAIPATSAVETTTEAALA